MPSRTKFVSFRIPESLHVTLAKRARSIGQSPGGLAREIVVEKLASQEVQQLGVSELHQELKKLRSELAVATEALLTVIGGTKESAGRAAAWVRRNLNR